MKFTQDHMTKAAEHLAADYEVLKEIEAGDGTMEEAVKLFKKARPDFNWNKTMIQLILLQRNGYVEGVRDADGHMMKPMKVRITEKGHEYFREKIEQCQEMAKETPTA